MNPESNNKRPSRCLARLVVPWPDEDDYDGETAQLYRTVDQDWSFQFPGWKWVANQINAEYGNNRTAAACRSKWMRWVEAQFIRHNADAMAAADPKLTRSQTTL